MTNIFRKILGLGPSKPTNVRPQQTKTIVKPVNQTKKDLSDLNIYPSLVSGKTTEFDMNNEIAAVFHERESIYANIYTTYVMLDDINLDEEGDPQLLHIKTATKDESYYNMLVEKGAHNLDIRAANFEFWNPIDDKLPYQVLSSKLSFIASESILSKKHMLEAHKMLDCDELMVSIPRKGLIFIADNNLEAEHKKNFMNMHAYLIMDNKYNLEILCEDIFMVKNGKIEGVLEINQLSDLLRIK